MCGSCHLFVKRILAIRDECFRRQAVIQYVPVFFSAITRGQHVTKATEWFVS
jgi:hypothetical protein